MQQGKATSIDIALRQAEQQGEREGGGRLSARMQTNIRDLGGVDSLRRTILTYVLKEDYARAIEDLKMYMESKSDYPQFATRAEKYIGYCGDLIYAIKAKRSFPGLQHLPMAKQQELFDRAMDHFEDLKRSLVKIEHIEKEVRLEDVRSTVWVVKALMLCVFGVLVIAFLRDLSLGLFYTFGVVIDDAFGRLSNLLFEYIGM